MGIISAGLFLTLDGVYQAPGGAEEDTSGGFDLGGWTGPLFDEVVGQQVGGAMSRSDAMLLGRKTYDIFAAFWPNIGDETGVQLTNTTKYVASRTLTDPDWANTTVLGPDFAQAVQEIKDRHDVIGMSGSGNLVQSLLAEDLLDELVLFVFPVILGKGKRLFAEGAPPQAFSLVESVASPSGVQCQTYHRNGAVQRAESAG